MKLGSPELGGIKRRPWYPARSVSKPGGFKLGQEIVQQLINGLVLGSTYALIGLGLTIIYGILGIVN
jgi:hypothetical protein